MRKPLSFDRFYPGDPMELYETINKYFLNLNKKPVKIAIAPHASYSYSGKCLGSVYSSFDSEDIKNVDTIILLGPNHSGIGGKISLSYQSFLSPFGKIEPDLDLIRMIKKNSDLFNLHVFENEEAHNKEHCLEVQLPFIQSVFRKEVKIAPIIFKSMDYEECVAFARVLFESVETLNKNVKIIVSSDFTHHGKFYNFVKFKENPRENLYNLDSKSIDFILNFDSQSFYDYAVAETSICGIFSITIAIELAKLFQCSNSEKVCFYNSGDVNEDYLNSVNYAGIIFW